MRAASSPNRAILGRATALLAGAAALLLAGCNSANLASLQPAALPAVESGAWTQAGADQVLELRPTQPRAATHRLDGLTLAALTKAGWTPDKVRRWMAHLPPRLAECGIALGPVRLVMLDGDPPPAAGDWSSRTRRFAAALPGGDGPLMLFTGSLGTDGDIGGQVPASAGGTRPIAFIAARSPSGRSYRPEQTVAHELGHLLGLAHVPPRNAKGEPVIDMMTPRGCLHCGFTPAECGTMRASPLVRPIG